MVRYSRLQPAWTWYPIHHLWSKISTTASTSQQTANSKQQNFTLPEHNYIRTIYDPQWEIPLTEGNNYENWRFIKNLETSQEKDRKQ